MKTLPLHNSRLLEFRAPQGALNDGCELTLTFDAGSEHEADLVMLVLITTDGSISMPMEHVAGGSFRKSFVISSPPGLLWYYFKFETSQGDILYYGGKSGVGSVYKSIPPAYQITVYDKSFTAPKWLREGIMYQIFPDRFAKGKKTNAGLDYHRSLGRSPRVHEDWNAQPYYLPGEGQDYYTPDDFYLGDLAGILEKLDYLKSLGVSVLYLNPIFESGSNHRYDTADFLKVDPILGDNRELHDLCQSLAENGIHVILDGVFSHTGADSIYFNKYKRYGDAGACWSEDSPYRSWYDFSPGSYRAWWGFVELPEVQELDPGYLDFVMDGENSVLKHWASHGITSWRLDVADELPDEFIKRLRSRMKEADPDCALLGEVWEDASNKQSYGVLREYVFGHELDSVMNYPFRNAAVAFMLNRTDAYGLNSALQSLRENYPKPFYYSLMNLLSSHDIVRAATALGGASERDDLPREAQAVFTLDDDARELGKARLIALTALQMALPGLPSIYYGDEAGLLGMADPFNRTCYPWGKEDERMLAAFKAYTHVRSNSPAARSGFCRMGAYNLDVFAVLRFTGGGVDAFGESAPESAVICLINRARIPMHVRLRADMLNEGPDAHEPVSLNGVWTQALSAKRVVCTNEVFEIIVESNGAALCTRDVP